MHSIIRAKIAAISLTATAIVITSLFWQQHAFAHKGASGVVKQRMDAMNEMKVQVKIIDQVLSGKRRFSVKKLQSALEFIKRHGGTQMTNLFPKDSTQHPSEAEPAIWQNWQTFERQAQQLVEQTDAFMQLIAAQKSGKTAGKTFRPNYLQLRKACKTCHDQFRQ